MSDLKPCPFCGEIPLMVHSALNEYHSVAPKIGCSHCRYIIQAPDLAIDMDKSVKENCDFEDSQTISYWNTRPAEEAKDREIERLNKELGIQKNLTRQSCFVANSAYDEVEKWKKMFYDLFDKQASISTDPKVIVTTPDTGKMEENK